MNSVQIELDAIIGNMLAETGKARIIIVKARQLGISTYVSGRFYHRTRHDGGMRANITTHRDDATHNLLDMNKRFHQNDPDPQLTKENNADGLVFANDSGFSIATAGAVSTGAGRSFTFQLAHLSELAFWKNASDHLTAILDAVPDAPGSEVIIESTAQGSSGPFYQMAMAAREGSIDYRLVFLPWFKHDEYATAPPEGWTPGDAVRELAVRYDLTAAQLYWAETKNRERAAVDGEDPSELCWRFRQEYPGNVDEAFRAGRTGGFIAASVVAKARARENPHTIEMPLILGCDFATGGGGGDNEGLTAEQLQQKEYRDKGSEDGDSNVFISRRGRVLGREIYERFKDKNTVSVANKLAAAVDRLNPVRVFMDRGGGGAQVYDILCQRGYARTGGLRERQSPRR